MTIEAVLDLLEERLSQLRLQVGRVGHTLNVSHGRGIMAHKANIDPHELLERLEGEPSSRHARLIAGYASGVQHVLLEPARSTAKDWTFVESAGSLVPSIEVDTFVLGARAASGESPWVKAFHDDLVVVYLMQLDRGVRVLPESQVAHWGVTSDRVTSGARSLLFHKTRAVAMQTYAQCKLVQHIRVGDGLDAARCTVFADAFYTEVDDESFRFSLPAPDLMLFTFLDTPEHIEELKAATRQAFASAEYPLSERIFAFEVGKPVPHSSSQNSAAP